MVQTARTGPAAARLGEAITTFMKRAPQRRRLAYALIAEPCEPELDRARLLYRAALERLIGDGVARGEFRTAQASTAASCVAGAMMEALDGPLPPAVRADSRTAGTLIRTTADLCVTMLAGAR